MRTAASDDSENSAGPCFDSSSSGDSEREDSDDFVEEVAAPAGDSKANDGGSSAEGAAQLLSVRRPKPKEPFPRARKQRLLLARQSAVASRGESPPHPTRRMTLAC